MTATSSARPVRGTRDQVAAELLLADQLEIERWALLVGGSAGGMRAVECAVPAPDRVERMLLLATTAAASADQISDVTLTEAMYSHDVGRGRGGVDAALARVDSVGSSSPSCWPSSPLS